MNFDTRFGRAMMERKIAEVSAGGRRVRRSRVDRLRQKVGAWLIASGRSLRARGERMASTDPDPI